ncbi:MAG: two-component sensor histidine kinase [Methylomonas sp.]|nr:MAG: two-component sensor histidine kinase [Methylobacter sp.]PPD37209.1 MAG: two-component sensor histidine kinase [Methylomonas sp.]
MGRLFWKFFLSFWLTLLIAGFGVGSAVFLRHQAEMANQANPKASEPVIEAKNATALIETAARLLNYGGTKELSAFLENIRTAHIPQIYAVDDDGKELLDRKLSAEKLSKIRNLNGKGRFPEAIRLTKAADGHNYLLFIPLPEHGFPPSERRPLLEVGELFEGRPPPLRAHFGESPDFHRFGPPPGNPRPLIPIIAGIIASILFSAGLAWYFAMPIHNLRRVFADLAQGNLDTRVAHLMSKRRDELADLGRDFDHMAEQLQVLMHAQQRLLHDVSHELRSPLARIQASIGLAQQQPEKLPAMLERIERESQRMSDLIGEILVLSRLETGVITGSVHEFDIGAVIDEVIDNASFEAKQKRVVINYQGIASTLANGNEELIYRAIENVVRNAVQYCKECGEVNVKADYFLENARLCLVVDDQGPGVAPSDLTAIFEPFFRSGKSRKPDSVGLGLSIAYRSIVAHGGSIKASNLPQSGLRMQIEIPFGNLRKTS